MSGDEVGVVATVSVILLGLVSHGCVVSRTVFFVVGDAEIDLVVRVGRRDFAVRAKAIGRRSDGLLEA